MPFDRVPEGLAQAGASIGVTFFLAWLGRLMYHVRRVSKRERAFWSWHLAWDLPTALAIGFVADGLADYAGLAGKPTMAVVIVVAYLGPGFIESVILGVIDRYAPPRPGDK